MAPAAVVVIGPSQHGKSSFVELALAEGESGQATAVDIGSGDGTSCTAKPALYENTVLGTLIDTPGYNDTKLRFTNTAAGLMVADLMMQHNITEAKFILVNSLVDMAQSLPNTLKEFNLVFPNAFTSACVLATQVDKVNPQTDVPLKYHQLTEKCKSAKIAAYMQWKSRGNGADARLPKDEVTKQFQDLKHRIGLLPTYKLAKTAELEARIERKMDELQAAHGTTQEEHTEQVEEDYVEDYEDEEEVPVPETVTEFVDVTETVPVQVSRIKELEEPYEKANVFGVSFQGTRKREVAVTEVDLKEVRKQVPVTNSTTRWEKKKVTKQRVCKRTVPKTVMVTIEIPREQFKEQAKQAIASENEEQIRALINDAVQLHEAQDDV
jgi:GTP-binding protein EngB required for normal cell division